jgi:exosortase family protein XrtF
MDASEGSKSADQEDQKGSVLQAWWNDRFKRFIGLAALLYTAWYVGYEIYLQPLTGIDRYVIDNLVLLGSFVLKGLGYDLIPTPPEDVSIRTIGIDGTHGLWIGDPCNGLTLFALFSIFVIAYPGPIRKKAWFIPLGLISIHLLNVLRIVALSIIVTYDYAYLDFNHTYTFSIIVYGYVFFLWYLWAGNLANRRKESRNAGNTAPDPPS